MNNFCEHLSNFLNADQNISVGVFLLQEHYIQSIAGGAKGFSSGLLIVKILKNLQPNDLYFQIYTNPRNNSLLKLIYSANLLSCVGINNSVVTIVASSVNTQGRIQNLVKHLRWNVLRKRATALNRSLFSQKSPFYMFGWELNSPLTLV